MTTAERTSLTDAELLGRYARTQDAEAFGELAGRHLDWIYSMALRITRNAALAEDVTQGVLLALAQKAGALQRHPALGAWLFRATRFGAQTALRAERRRKVHEGAAMAMRTVEAGAEGEWVEVLPRLDAAIAGLAAREREVILLRFYQQLTQMEVGKRLGISEEAARKRVDRAVGRLRRVLGMEGDGAAFSGMLATGLVVRAPAHLHAVAGGAALATPQAVALSKGIHTIIAVAKLKMAAVVLVVVLPMALIGGVLMRRAGAPVVARVTVPVVTPVPAAPASAPATFNGIVTGIVKAPDGRPAADIAVEINSYPVVTSTRTAANGRFMFKLKDERAQEILATNSDGSLQAYYDRYDRVTHTFQDDVTVLLKAARQIPITVLDEKSAPVADAHILASQFRLLGQATSDAQGKAVLRLPADAPVDFLLAAKDGMGLDYRLVQRDPIASDPYHLAEKFTGPVAFMLNGARSVTIRVVDDQQHPLPGVRVYPWYFEKPKRGGDANFSGVHFFDEVTGSDGTARFDFIPADAVQKVTFWVKREGYTSLERWMWDPAAPASALTATLYAQIPVTGHVVDAEGKAVSGATVRVGGAGYTFDDFRGQTTSNADGAFQVLVDPEQFYLLVAQKGEEVSAPLTEIVRKSVTAEPMTLELEAGRHVFGQVSAAGKPVPHAFVSLVQFEPEAYNKLPEGEQFPGGTLHRKSIEPCIEQYVETDNGGNYEFFTFPSSDGYVEADIDAERVSKRLNLRTREEVEANLHSEASTTLFHGRVVLSEKPGVAVGEAIVSTVSEDMEKRGMRAPEAVTDKEGLFEFRRPTGSFRLFAKSVDDSHAGMAVVAVADGNEATISLVATATAKGRVMGADGRAAARTLVYWGMEVGPEHGPWQYVFGGRVTTGADGTFSLSPLVPKVAYTLEVMAGDDSSAGGKSAIAAMTTVTAQQAGVVEVGDVVEKGE